MRRGMNIHTFKAYEYVDIPAFHFYVLKIFFVRIDMKMICVALSNLGKRTCCD